jgi:ABC-type phosphate transport system permease subunit
MNNKLSADPISLILGIVSLVIIFLGCCCGIFAFIALGIAIIGIVIANKSLNEFNANSENYSIQSKNNVSTGKIICIIATVISSLFVLFYIAYLAFFGSVFTKEVMEKYYKNNFEKQKIEDTLSTKNYDEKIEEDSLYIDTLKVEQIK